MMSLPCRNTQPSLGERFYNLSVVFCKPRLLNYSVDENPIHILYLFDYAEVGLAIVFFIESEVYIFCSTESHKIAEGLKG